MGEKRTTGCSQPGNTPAGATPVLRNSSSTHPAPSQVTIALPSARAAIAMTSVAIPAEIATGTSTKPSAAIQP